MNNTLAVGQRVRHIGFGATGTVTRFDPTFEVWVVTLDQPLQQIGSPALEELSGTESSLKVILS